MFDGCERSTVKDTGRQPLNLTKFTPITEAGFEDIACSYHSGLVFVVVCFSITVRSLSANSVNMVLNLTSTETIRLIRDRLSLSARLMTQFIATLPTGMGKYFRVERVATLEQFGTTRLVAVLVGQSSQSDEGGNI